jgi:hypothetical protein
MMGTLAGKSVGTVGAIGCVLQPEKGPVASSSEQRKHGWMWRETVLSVRTAFGGLRTLPPMDSMQASKGGPGAIAWWNKRALINQHHQPEARTSASAPAVPLLHAAWPRSFSVGNNLADVGKIIPLSGCAVARFADRFNIFANAFDRVARRSQQGSRKQDDRCKFAHNILHHSRLTLQTPR